METLKLDVAALAVEGFDAAAREAVPPREMPSTAHCSAIDACPTRLCDTSIC
jgi:hypothetical protein